MKRECHNHHNEGEWTLMVKVMMNLNDTDEADNDEAECFIVVVFNIISSLYLLFL